MDILIILGLFGCVLAAALTVPAGFGLATMTTPIFLIWFEPHQAIAGVAIVHGAHNAIKAHMLRQHIDKDALRRFGWALLLGALIGALLHLVIPSDPLLLLVGFALVSCGAICCGMSQAKRLFSVILSFSKSAFECESEY